MKLKLLLLTLGLVLLILNQPQPVKAQVSPCITGDVNSSNVKQGVITSPSQSNSNSFQSSSGCITESPAYIDLNAAEIRLSNFADLYARFYDKAPATINKQVISSQPINIIDKTLYLSNGDLTLTSSPTGSGVGIVFVKGDLNITSDITYKETDQASGLVFVVSGNINIYPTVSRIDAILVAQKQICSVYQPSLQRCQSNYPPAPDLPLVINGNIVTLDPSTPPALFRNLFGNGISSNTVSAEQIYIQPKYYVILKDIFSQNLQYTTENTNFALNVRPCADWGACTGSQCQDDRIRQTRDCPDQTGEPTRICSNPGTCYSCTIAASGGSCSPPGGSSGSESFQVTYGSRVSGSLNPTGTLTPDVTTSTSVPVNGSTTSYNHYSPGSGKVARFTPTNTTGDPTNDVSCVTNIPFDIPFCGSQVALTANPQNNLPYNSRTSLNWSSTNSATSCNATSSPSVWSGAKPTSGSELSTPLTTTTTFNLSCTNAAGNSPTASVTVSVCSAPLTEPACHTTSITGNNGSCGLQTFGPNCNSTSSSCVGNQCCLKPGSAPDCRTNSGSVPNGSCGTSPYSPNCGTSCSGSSCCPQAQSCPNYCGYPGGSVANGFCGTTNCPAVNCHQLLSSQAWFVYHPDGCSIEWKWLDTYNDTGTVESSHWTTNNCAYFERCDDGYSTDHYGMQYSAIDYGMSVGRCVDGVCRNIPGYGHNGFSDHNGSCNFDHPDANSFCQGCGWSAI